MDPRRIGSKWARIVERESALVLVGEAGETIRTQIFDRALPTNRERAQRALTRAARAMGYSLVNAVDGPAGSGV